MVETSRSCIEVLARIAAATRALQSVTLHLLDEHPAHCVADALRDGEGAEAKAGRGPGDHCPLDALVNGA